MPSPGSRRVLHLSPLCHPPPQRKTPKRLVSCAVLVTTKGEAAFVVTELTQDVMNGNQDMVWLEGPHQPT